VRIVYVEDTLLNLCLIERIARMGGHEVINYAYGEQALEHFERDKPDLLLVDLRLEGEMTGIQLIEKLRNGGQTLPIVVITALEGRAVEERCKTAGCTEFHVKPLMVREMVRLLHRYAKEKSAEKSAGQVSETDEARSSQAKPAS
jgi:CheY-like chemotaxis protein